jgi:hypothetical protein
MRLYGCLKRSREQRTAKTNRQDAKNAKICLPWDRFVGAVVLVYEPQRQEDAKRLRAFVVVKRRVWGDMEEWGNIFLGLSARTDYDYTFIIFIITDENSVVKSKKPRRD